MQYVECRSPLRAVHFPPDRTHGCDAGRAQEVEQQERIRRQLRQPLEFQDAEHADDLFLREQTHEGRNGFADIAEADGHEDPGNTAGDHTQNTVFQIHRVAVIAEGTIHRAEIAAEPPPLCGSVTV